MGIPRYAWLNRLHALDRKNCPAAWHGQFQGHKKSSTIILEAVADHETWFWHAFFGMPGSCNDINVLQRSPLMNKIANDEILIRVKRIYNFLSFHATFMLLTLVFMLSL